MLRNEFERDNQIMRNWFQNEDIIIVDRGYRDACPMLAELGIHVKMPSFLEPGKRQLTTEQANQSRLITKTRWIVESRSGHIKTVFKFFANTIIFPHVNNLVDFYHIEGAILNRMIEMAGADEDLAQRLLHK